MKVSKIIMGLLIGSAILLASPPMEEKTFGEGSNSFKGQIRGNSSVHWIASGKAVIIKNYDTNRYEYAKLSDDNKSLVLSGIEVGSGEEMLNERVGFIRGEVLYEMGKGAGK